MTAQQAAFTGEKKSPFALYRELAVGEAGVGFLAWYEGVTVVASNIPGLLGLSARALLYPTLFERCGARPAFGRGVLLRNPKKISIGKKVLVDDYAVLDVRGEDASITLGDHVCIGRFSTIAAKGGHIRLGDGVNIGSYCRIATQTSLVVEESTLVAAYAYIGPGNHQRGDEDTPLIAREMDIRGGVTIGAHAWIGARATILDGVSIGAKAIVGAHSLVREDVPEGAIVAGTPARVIGAV